MTQYELESEIVRRDIELRHQRARVESLSALLRECQDAVRVAASAEEDHGAMDKAREWDALAGRIREVLG